MSPPKPPFLLKLPAPTLAPDGVVLVLDPRSMKGHYVCCMACAATKGMSLSTFVQKHHVNSGSKCLTEYNNLPEGSLYLPLNEIEGWKTYSAASGRRQGEREELNVEELNVKELNMEELNVAAPDNEGTGDRGEVDSELAVGGGVALSDDYIKLKLSQNSKKKLSWLAGLRGRYSGKSDDELVDMALQEYRKEPFPLE